MKLPRFLREKPSETIARRLYVRAVEQARQPVFYLDLGVPDTPDGRFDMVAVHVMLLLRRLRREKKGAADEAQALFDYMFADMDQNLREMGVGDIGVGKRIKGMAQAFYGRIGAYDAGLDADDDALEEAVRRNVYRKADPDDAQVAAVADYMRNCAAVLATVSLEALLAGDVSFAAPPASAHRSPP